VEVGDGGTVFVLQGYFGAANQGKILMTTVALDGGLSTTSAFSTTNPTQGVDVSMAARGNVVHAAWSFNYPPPAGGSYSTDVRYGSFRNGGWSTQVLRSANVLPFANAVATVMLQSTPHVLIAFNQEVVDVTVSGSSPSQVVASDAGIYSLGAASNGPLMVAALFGSPSGSLHSISSSGSSWSPRTAIEPTGSFLAYPPGVAVDALGRAHVAYVDELRARPRYALLQNGTWTREDVENLQMGYSIDLDVDRAGNPHVCFVTGTPGNVRYGVKRNGAWRMENVTTVGNGPSRCAIAVGPADEVYIVISDPGGLRLAR
jgi:hypothetical protein